MTDFKPHQQHKPVDWDLCWIPTKHLILEIIKRMNASIDVLTAYLEAMGDDDE